MYLIETDDNKHPDVFYLGGRMVNNNTGEVSGVWNEYAQPAYQLDGHINRNIRLMYSMLQMVDPFIEVVGMQDGNLYWRVQGCADEINSASFKSGNQTLSFKPNYLSPWECFLKGDETFKTTVFES